MVRVRLIGSGKNTNAVGAALRAEIGGVTQTRFVSTGGSYLSQSELTATFGLGPATSITRLTVRWPDGSQSEFPNLTAGSLCTIQQGNAAPRCEPLHPRRVRVTKVGTGPIRLPAVYSARTAPIDRSCRRFGD